MILYIGIFLVVYLAFDWLQRRPRVSGLHKKCVVITGCDTGFGNALAKSLYRKGVYVFAGCYTANGAKKLAEETGERLKIFMVDVGKTESVKQAFDFVQSNLPPDTVLWGLVNNVGIQGIVLPIEFISKSDMNDTMNVNCYSMIDMTRAFLPLIKESRGWIVNLASGCSKFAAICHHPYTVSKYGVLGFSEGLRREKAVWGIKVSAICPGFYRTNIVNPEAYTKRNTEAWKKHDASLRDQYGQEYFDKFVATENALGMAAPTDLSPVINDIEHALFARRPRGVYHSGMESKLLMFVQEWLPAFISDKLMDVYIRDLKINALK